MKQLPAWCRDVALLDASAPVPLDRPFTAAYASTAGVPATLRHRLVRLGLLRPVLRGVFVASQVPDSLRLRVAAVRLVVPEHAVAVDRTASWVHGVDALPRRAIHEMPGLDVYSAAGSRLRRPGVSSGVRELAAHDVEIIDGLRLTTPLRTACDVGRRLWRYDALGAIDGFLRLGVDAAELVAEADRFKGYRGVRQLRHLAPLGDPGAESPPESALRLHWIESDIGSPDTQIWVEDDDGRPRFRIDVGQRETRYGAEYFGGQFHAEEHREHDESRLAWLRSRGWCIDVFTSEHVYGDDLAAGAMLRTGYHRARATLGLRTATYIDLGRRTDVHQRSVD